MIPNKGKNIKKTTSIEEGAHMKIEGRNGKEQVIKWSELKTLLNADLDFAVTPTYSVYRALITQSSTNAPTIKVLENTIGNIAWSRNAQGNYYGTLAGTFTEDKVYSQIMNSNSGIYGDIVAGRLNDNVFEIWTASSLLGSEIDGALTDASIEIRVYS